MRILKLATAILPFAIAGTAEAQPIPVLDISIGSDFIQIDDLDLLGPNDRDANLCSLISEGEPACPSSLYTDLAAFKADNPNFPGPNPLFPAVLGPDADYVDWADIDFNKHFAPFLDRELKGLPDDIFSPDSCYSEGNSPSKANATVMGLAANDKYMYLDFWRQTSNGQEEYHIYATQKPPVLGDFGSCKAPTWLWDLQDGDIEITLRWQSTAGLPDGEAKIRRWAGGDVSGVTAQELLLSTDWAALPAGPTPPAGTALNVSGDDKKAPPGEDNEFKFDGSIFESGIHTETYIDIDQVFGRGCGLTRTIHVLTTSSGSGGRRDDIKDTNGPYTVSTGVLVPTFTLYESCDEEFAYNLKLALGLDGTTTNIPLPSTDFDVALEYDCGSASSSTSSPVLPSGTIGVPTDTQLSCDVRVKVTGLNEFAACDADVTKTVAVYPLLEASGKLAQACDGTFSWSTTIDGGSGSSSLLWTFDVVDGGTSSSATSTDASGTATLSSGLVGSASVSAQLKVTDAVIRDTAAGAETCSATPNVAGVIAHRPLNVSITPLTGDGECPANDVSGADFRARVVGGSGVWDYDWTQTGDAVLDNTCAAIDIIVDGDQQRSDNCSFDLGPGFCADGSVKLLVTDQDPECVPDSDMIKAVRTSKIDVTPDPAP